ncbi:MAG: D-alanyl-D-alanine carboxypeptidase family protein [Candidatus Daviesbacteria bacterium]|nr:D-alanyl-D-alanine carboxypeptidase family protein [Candidatus Daviesbacteria bacterium]
MMPILYTIAVTFLSISVLIGLPSVTNLIQTKVEASNIPNNKVLTQNEFQPPIEIIKPIPIPKNQGIPAPLIYASAVVVKDLATNTLLFGQGENQRVPIASTTKIMTALVAVEHFRPNDVLIVPENIFTITGSSMGLKPGEQLSFRSVLYGMLLNSGNDAAYTIAQNYPGGFNVFVQAMNKKAISLGLINTHFTNPAGFDDVNHYSSAEDLAKIASLAIENSQLARVVSTKETSVASLDKTTIHSLKNLNKLLDEPGVLGIKTGTTPAARENLVGLVERDGHKILTVVLGSNDRFGETDKLFNWVYSNFVWK